MHQKDIQREELLVNSLTELGKTDPEELSSEENIELRTHLIKGLRKALLDLIKEHEGFRKHARECLVEEQKSTDYYKQEFQSLRNEMSDLLRKFQHPPTHDKYIRR